MKSAAMLVLLSCATLIGAAEPSKDAAPQENSQMADSLAAQNMREALRAAVISGSGRNCYYMRVVQPADQHSADSRWSEGPSDAPRFIPLQVPSQARLRPLVSTVVCSNDGAIRKAVRKLP
jgi:hypothetical protein